MKLVLTLAALAIGLSACSLTLPVRGQIQNSDETSAMQSFKLGSKKTLPRLVTTGTWTRAPQNGPIGISAITWP